MDLDHITQPLIALMLGMIGFGVRVILNRLYTLEKGQAMNTNRLVRIETKLGIGENGHELA